MLSADKLPPALNLERGLASTGGDLALYIELLDMFCLTHGDDGNILRMHLAAGDLPALKKRAHSLKGSSGLLGADELHGGCTELEAAIRSGNDPATIAPLVQDLSARLDQLLTEWQSRRTGQERGAD